MKRYLLFIGYAYYPSGGLNDMNGHYETMEEAMQAASNDEWEWSQILDIATGQQWEAKRDLRDTDSLARVEYEEVISKQ